MKLKKVVAAMLAAVMTFGLCACGGSGNGAGTAEGSTGGGQAEYDKIVYAYAMFNNIPDADTLDTVEEAVNEITREKIGVEVELLPIGLFDYSSTVSLQLQGGDQIDVFQTLGDLNNCIASNMVYDITDLIEEYGSETKEIVGEDFLSTCKKDGRLYAVPTYKPYALTAMVVYRQDIADELEIDMTQVKDVYDLTDVFRQVKDAYPSMTPLAPVQTGDSGVTRSMAQVDSLTDDWFSQKGVLIGDDMTVQDMYSTEEFRNRCDLVREWYQEGLILQDAATTTSTSTELMASGNCFCYIASYSYPTEDTAAVFTAQCGVPLGAVQIQDAYLATDSINAVSWVVSSTTKVPEAAMKFLNLTYTDPEIVNLLIWGIEGRDYVLTEDGYASYPEGESAATVPYTAQLSSGTLGNCFLPYPMLGTSKESLVWEEEQNKVAKKSPAMGFTFDSSSLKTEYSAVTNVLNQYLPGLLCGSVDPETTFPEFIERLNEAGYDKILEEKQKQLDAWAASN